MHSVKHVILALAVLLFATACSKPRVEVFSIANEGFLVRSQRHAVLIDALFEATAPYPDFFQQGPSAALVERMIAGEDHFSDIDLALVTHVHGDHFRAGSAFDFLEHHPETLLVGTRDVVDQLAAIDGFEALADRVVAPVESVGSCESIERAGAGVTVCLVWHSGGGDIANNIYIVDIDGFRFLHEGDADRSPTTFAGLPIGETGFDLAFLHDWFVLNDGREVVTDILRPGAVVLMHHRWAAAIETRDRLDALPLEIAATMPPVTVFGAELESAVFGSTAD
jgi:L-ascorbate metabolism protein UlaG (beta-lactamase superfamily)